MVFSIINSEVEEKYDEKLKEFLIKEGYKDVRILKDGIVGTIDYITTRAVLVGLDYSGFEARYCYQNRPLASLVCQGLKSVDDKPAAGFSAIKGKVGDYNAETMAIYVKGKWG